MKKTFLGVLASLMLAGAISAASDLTTGTPVAGMVAIVSDGTSPVPLLATPVANPCDLSSRDK